MQNITVHVHTEDLSVDAALVAVADPAHGAIDTFIGVVRNHHEGNSVTGITYDVHESLAKQVFADICSDAQKLYPKAKYYVAHRQGFLLVGGVSIVIAVSSPHRAESFDACRFVIEEIKKRAPVWKQEHYVDGESEWLPGHSLTAQSG